MEAAQWGQQEEVSKASHSLELDTENVEVFQRVFMQEQICPKIVGQFEYAARLGRD